MDSYGKELILDLHECSTENFSRQGLKRFFEELCELIQMEREEIHHWDYEDVPEEERPTEAHLLGPSAVQFIKTSNIVVHALELLKNVYINVFSCKDFDADEAARFAARYFCGKTVSKHVIIRK